MSVGSSPTFPSNMIPYEPNAYVLNHVNIAISRKLLKIKIVYTRQTIRLLKILYRVGLVKNFSIIKLEQTLYIWLTPFFYKNVPFFKSAKLISTSSKKFYVSYRALKLLGRSVGSSIYILSTSRGLMTHLECLSYRTGGILLCAIS